MLSQFKAKLFKEKKKKKKKKKKYLTQYAVNKTSSDAYFWADI